MRTIYFFYVPDIVYSDHLASMRNANAIAEDGGKLIVGILTDEAVMEKKKKPILLFAERMDLTSRKAS